MPPWTDLAAPALAFFAGLPAVTLALVLWRRTRDRSFELLATGLGLLAVLSFLLSVGIFLAAARLVENPDLRFVLWNTTFLISFVSLVVLRRFVALVVPGPQTTRAFPRLFSVVSAAVYGTVLILAFALTPPWVDFHGRAVYAWSAAYYLGGFAGPGYRLWKARRTVPGWVGRLLGRAPVMAPLAVALVVYEAVRWAFPADAVWPSLGSLGALVFFVLVVWELFRILGSPEVVPPSSNSVTDRAQKIAARCVADPLTRRELEILGLLLEGWRNQDIADRLGVSPNTVKNHVYSLYQKTGVANRVELSGLAEG